MKMVGECEFYSNLIDEKDEQMEKLENRSERVDAGHLELHNRQNKQITAIQASLGAVEAEKAKLKKLLAEAESSSELVPSKEKRILELEGQLNQAAIESSNRQAASDAEKKELAEELEKVKSEANEAVADMVTAQEEKDISDMMTGISEDGSASQLSEMRELRRKAKAEARIASELAGTDTKSQEAEFLEYARTSEANSEFDALIGLAQKDVG